MKYCKLIITGLCLFHLMTASATSLPGDYETLGKAKLSVWFWDIYIAEFKTKDGTYQPGDKEVKMSITYLREIANEDLIKETSDQWQRFELPPTEESRWLSQLASFWPTVNRCDEITFQIDRQGATHFYYNQALIGSIVDARFSHYFIDIWLAPDGPYPKMTRQLLGKEKGFETDQKACV